MLVLYLSRVSSCDSAGLAVLIGAERRARVLGVAMRLAAPSIPVVRLPCRTGLDRGVTSCPDRRSTLAADGEPARPPGSPPGRRGCILVSTTTVALASGHPAMVSHPDEVAQLIKTAAGAVPVAG